MNRPPEVHRSLDRLPAQANAVEQAIDLDYDVPQAFCSHILPTGVLLFTVEAPDDGMNFEPEDGEGDDDDEGGRRRGTKSNGFALSSLDEDNR